ncbi:PucR C-terminal helix-turn-helix domain-containing protein [Actinomadura meyerae]|uniref:PucR C-terminal helix-turn-helix domain-containing protein n=1 Tax=Actinomadura meyerae TaxID=240840 RepID=A0A239LM96_9ACTN|nr:PucR family transcriptional regulator [Actinomadura meyerae]SNT31601.1 PucR C-terminal helix-turn-helix domain-containing protein [Actinomadura meyerae]
MRLRSLLAMPELRLEVVTGADELDRTIRWVVTTDLLDPGRYLRGRELVLTGLVWRTGPADSETFVRALAGAGVSGLAAWDLTLGAIPDDLVDACRRHRLPLFKVPEDVAFATVTEEVVRHLSSARAADLAAVLDRHRRLVEGTGLGAVLDLVGHCHVLAPTGRVVAGSAPADAEALARAFLTAPRLPHHEPALDASLFAVAGGGTPRVADWFLVFDGDFADWPAERRALTGELAAIVALERARRDAPAAVDADLLIAGDAARLGLPADARHTAVAASGGGALRPGEVRTVLAEILPFRMAALLEDELEDEVVGLVPAEGRDVAAELQAALDLLSPGLLSPGRAGGGLAVGVSGVAAAPDLRGAVEEARHARRLAAARPGPARVVRHDELATHVLLLASVPDDVRRMFTVRLLDPLLDYDRTHGADLVRTLETFLRHSGSWTRCAEQLHLHVNSVRYRIQRVEELTGRDLSRLEDRVDFFLALRLTWPSA